VVSLSFATGRGATGSESKSSHSAESRLVCLRVFFSVAGIGLLRDRLLVDFGDAVTVRAQEFCGCAAFHVQDGRSPWGCIAVPFRKLGTRLKSTNSPAPTCFMAGWARLYKKPANKAGFCVNYGVGWNHKPVGSSFPSTRSLTGTTPRENA
jgi:hypothetical protein